MATPATAYRLDDVRLEAIEARVVEQLRAGGADRTVACAVVDGASELAHFGRTFETRSFPDYDFAGALAPYEDRSIFLYTVDLERGRIAHVKRLVLPVAAPSAAGTGIEIIDDRLRATSAEERAELGEIVEYHEIADLRRCLNLTTNLGTDRAKPTRERPYSLLSYKAVFLWGMPRRFEHLFAYVNQGAVRSLGRIGIQGSLLLDREYHLPDPAGGYDLEYVAVHIDGGPRSVEVFTVGDPGLPFTRVVAGIDLPVVVLLDEELIDLTDEALDRSEPADDRAGPSADQG